MSYLNYISITGNTNYTKFLLCWNRIAVTIVTIFLEYYTYQCLKGQNFTTKLELMKRKASFINMKSQKVKGTSVQKRFFFSVLVSMCALSLYVSLKNSEKFDIN